MNKQLFISLLVVGAALVSCSPKTPAVVPGEALFTAVEYVADAPTGYNPQTQYSNPIIPGFHPDPSICRVGEDYYIVNSTFQYFPGLPIWHSTDLVHWELLGNAIDENSDITYTTGGMSSGLFAATIRYNPYNKLFYVINTQMGGGMANFFVTTDDPKNGKWSDPVLLPDVKGIDPDILFDTDGKAYITSNGGFNATAGMALLEFDWENGVTVGEPIGLTPKSIYGGHDFNIVEGPHLYHIGDTYFLMCAEGGTELGHSEILFKADNPRGPYTVCDINPILTQRDLSPERENMVCCTGHADLVETPEGNWYAVFLGCQPYEGDYFFNTGRQTFLLPVEWINGQPVIMQQGKSVPTVVDMNDEMKTLVANNKIEPLNGYNPGPIFDKGGFKPNALFERNPQFENYSIQPDGNSIILKGNGVSLEEPKSSTALYQRITAKTFTAETTMTFNPTNEKKEAGLVCFQDNTHYFKFVKTLADDGSIKLVLESYTSNASSMGSRSRGAVLDNHYEVTLDEKTAAKSLILKVETPTADKYEFSFAVDSKNPSFTKVGEALDGKIISTSTAGGFQGAMVGIYAL